jgi:hypothetical protein
MEREAPTKTYRKEMKGADDEDDEEDKDDDDDDEDDADGAHDGHDARAQETAAEERAKRCANPARFFLAQTLSAFYFANLNLLGPCTNLTQARSPWVLQGSTARSHQFYDGGEFDFEKSRDVNNT